ncbi:hypothetical protein Tco_1267526 [Tanacetum coccineum]
MTSDEGTAKTTPRPDGSLGDKELGGNIPPADMEPIHPTVANLSRTGAKYHVDQTQSTRLRKMSNVLFAKIIEDTREKHKEAAINYVDLKASNDDYYNENIAHRDQTDKLVEASMSSLDKSSNTINDLYKGLNIITELLQEINNAVKDDSDYALKQDEELAAWAKSSTNMAWNIGSRLSGLERAQNHIQYSIVTPTLALTHILANVEGENATSTTTEEPLSHTKGRLKTQK